MTDLQDIIENDIEYYLQEFCDKYDIHDLNAESQNRFNACLTYINQKALNNKRLLKYNPDINNSYDIAKVDLLLDEYIMLCNTYTKECSIMGFSLFSGIHRDTFFEWGKNQACQGFDVYKKLLAWNEQTNSDLLTSGKNPVGVIARLNHVHGWNAIEKRNEEIAKNQALTADNLPLLSLSDVHTQETGQNNQVKAVEIVQDV